MNKFALFVKLYIQKKNKKNHFIFFEKIIIKINK
jgi:hypothetical protein